MTFKSITPKELHDRTQAGGPVNLIDVRSPAEFAQVHAAGARSVPLDTLSRNLIATQNGEAVYVICKSGGRSSAGCARLIEQGLTNVVNVEGGTMAWQQAGLPVEALSEATGASQGLGRSGWLRLAGVLGVVISLGLSIAASPYFAVVAGALWIAMAVTGNSPCCWADGCSTGKRT